MQANALKKREVSPPQHQPKSKKARSERPARPVTSVLPLLYMEMVAEESLDPQLMNEEPVPVERRAPLHPRGYMRLPAIEVQWYVTGNIVVFAEGAEVSFPQDLPLRYGADFLPIGPPTRYKIPIPMMLTTSFEMRNNPPAAPHVRRNVYVPPKLREEGAPLFQDVVVDEDEDDDDGLHRHWPLLYSTGQLLDGQSSSEFEENYDTPDESEDNATKHCWKARCEKEKRQTAAHRQEHEGKEKKECQQVAGDTPNRWETVKVNGRFERGNAFNGSLGPEFYYSCPFNWVFVELEVQAVTYAERAGEYFSPSMRLYEVVPRGMPMNPEELRQLVLFMRGHAKNTPPYDRVMPQRILMELDHIVHAVSLDLWDRTMQASQAFPGLSQDLRERILPHNDAWRWVSWSLNPQARVGNPSNLNQGAGLQPVPASWGLDIDKWCRYILHHGYPGSPNSSQEWQWTSPSESKGVQPLDMPLVGHCALPKQGLNS
ncbi:hypothetical protein H0H92_014097 [Tricholoma furcatifolium]|nr:hypothetical protein H0H92_014097 [Tricholoma furcatifolium]